jgi:RNA polymerase sigma-70 factor (ECF subfamily)
VGLDLRAAYEAEGAGVHAFLGRFGLRGADLEDAVHDTFVTALTRASTYDAQRPLRPWLLGIAFRMGVARVRGARDHTSQIPDQPDPRQDPHRALEARRAQALLQKALAELPEEQGTVFALFDLQGVPAAEIAESMGAPIKTTYSRLRLAREAFAATVKRLQGEAS